MKSQINVAFYLILITSLLVSCTSEPQHVTGVFPVVATTSIVADILHQVGDEHIQITTIIPPGTDPHLFEPRVQDAAYLAEARIVFASGAGLEQFLGPLLESTASVDKLVEVSQGIPLNFLPGMEQDGGDSSSESGDPHTWMDPANILVWVDNILAALIEADPQNADDYTANAEAYVHSIEDLDAWIRSEVEKIPTEQRLLVSDHAVLGYFARAYGFTQIGTLVGSFSTNSTPSAHELAILEDNIREYGIKAVFITEPANRNILQQMAKDTGIVVVPLYHASLTDADGPAPSYLELMRYNVSAIVAALK